MRLFLYGSLLDPALLAARAGRRIALTPAVLAGWQRAARPGSRFPTLCRARGGRVEGALATVDGAALRRLVAYEGLEYRLHRVAVRWRREDSGPATGAAWAWIAPGGTRRRWPAKGTG